MVWSLVSLFGYPSKDIYEYPSGKRSWFLTPLTGPHDLYFYRQLLKTTCRLYTTVRLEVTGISHGTLLPLTLKTSLNTNLVNIFNSTRIACRSSLTNLWYLPLQFQISTTYFYSWREHNNFLTVMIFERFFEYYTRKLNFYWNFNKLTVFAICCITKKR